MTIRESIILEARELAEGSPSKDTRSFARSVYEYLGNMTHNEAIKTARDALYCIEKGLEWHNRTTPKTIAREALTALDSLAAESKPLDPAIQAVVQENFWELAGKPAVESSDEARELVRQILTSYGNFCMKPSGYDYIAMFNESAITEAAAFITADCERIRRECSEILRTLPCVNDNETEIRREDAISAIVGEAKK